MPEMGSGPLLPASLERFLTLASDREQTIAGNMANVDTPGYQTRDINFKQTMLNAAFGGEEAQLTPVVSRVQGLLERPDGNNVDLDRESLLLAQSQLQYQMGTQLVKSQFHQLLSAINGGS
jgi:flagellar basal-body rod protein FlgB